VIDSALRPKAAYYYAKHFFAPVLVSCKREKDTISIWLTNDRLNVCAGKLTVRLTSFSGRTVWKRRLFVAGAANASAEVLRLDARVWRRVDTTGHYIIVRCDMDDGAVLENRFYFEEPKHLKLPRPKVKARISRNRDGDLVVIVKAATFVKNVRLEGSGGNAVFYDNYFDMEAGEERTVRVVSWGAKASELKGVSLRTLAD
jgi:beta-mannosidase